MDTNYLVREYLTHLIHLAILFVPGGDHTGPADFFTAAQPPVPQDRECFFIGDEVRLPYVA